jgi:hypothetical protein
MKCQGGSSVTDGRQNYVYICIVHTVVLFQVYTVEHNMSDMVKNTLHRRHVSACTKPSSGLMQMFEQTLITAVMCRRHLLFTSVIKILIVSCS